MSRTRKGSKGPGWEPWSNLRERQEQAADYSLTEWKESEPKERRMKTIDEILAEIEDPARHTLSAFPITVGELRRIARTIRAADEMSDFVDVDGEGIEALGAYSIARKS